MATDKDTPDTPSLANKRQAAAATICRDCYDGPLRIREQAHEYLPQFPRETPEAYNDRLRTSVFYDVFSRTVDGLTGIVMRTAPQLAEDLPDELKKMWENLDGLGTHGDVFLKERHADATTDGHFVFFVDMPRALSTDRVRADQANRLPYWIGIHKQDVIALRYGMIDNTRKPIHFRYRVKETIPKGIYGETEVTRIREYNLRAPEGGERFVEFIVHTKDERTDEWLATEPERMEIDEIPIVAKYHGKRIGPFESRPPLLPLALENIKHYQLVSDNDNVLHVCSVPQFVLIGDDQDDTKKATVGPRNGWRLPLEGDAKYVEPMGNALEAAANRINKSEQRMAVLGLSMLMSESRAAETLGSKRIDKSESDSALSMQSKETEDGAEEGMQLSAKWLSLTLPVKRDGRWVSLSKDFEHIPMDAEVMKAYIMAVAQAGLPIRVLLEAWKREFRIPDTLDINDLEEEMLANAAAKEEQERQQREDALALNDERKAA